MSAEELIPPSPQRETGAPTPAATGTTATGPRSSSLVLPAAAAWKRLRTHLSTAAEEPNRDRPHPESAARELAAGRLLVAVALTPALLLTAWLVTAVPLVFVGQFRILTAAPLFLAAAALIVPAGLRMALHAAVALRAPRWSVAAVVAIAAAFAVFCAATHSQQVVLHRDNGSYAQIGYWLAHNRQANAPVPAADFGTSSDLMTFSSPAFYRVGDHLVPQFMTGWPTVLAAGWWLGGWSGILLAPALVGAFAVLAFAGLAARLVGGRWAALAALMLATTFPVIKGAQTTFSEMPALLLLAAGLFMLTDALRLVLRTADHAPGDVPLAVFGRHAFAAGLVLGAGELVRLDVGLDIAVLMPVSAWWWATRRAGCGAFVAGAAAGLGLGGLDARLVAWPYVQENWSSVRLETIALLASATASFAVAWTVRRAGRTLWPASWRPAVAWVGAAAAALAGLALLVRPYLGVARQHSNPAGAQYLASLQTWLQLTPDGSRTYAEQSLRWVSWYVGWPTLFAAWCAAIVLAWLTLRGRQSWWLPFLLVYVGAGVLQLWQPSITPDHPYADRRLVTTVLPGAILLATWTAATLTRAALGAGRLRFAKVSLRPRVSTLRTAAAPTALTIVLIALLAPSAAASARVAAKRTESGEITAVRSVCRSLPANASVILIDAMSDQWMAAIRNQCGVPVGRLTTTASTATITQAAAAITAAGRTAVIAASGANPLQDAGYRVDQLRKVVVLKTRQDQQQLLAPPNGTKALNDVEFWYVRS